MSATLENPAPSATVDAPHHRTEAAAELAAWNILGAGAWRGFKGTLADLSGDMMPTPGTRLAFRLVAAAADDGAFGDLVAMHATESLAESGARQAQIDDATAALGQVISSHGFSVKLPLDQCDGFATVVRDHHRTRREWQIANLILQRKEGGDPIGDLVAELAALESGSTSPSLEAAIDARIFNHEHQPEKPVPIFSIMGSPIMTRGNIMNIQAPAKAGKSAAISGMMAAAMATRDDIDTLGFTSTTTSGALIHIDTEQSGYDHDALVRRAMRRAGIDAPPAWLLSYCLTDLSPSDRRQAVRIIASKAARNHGGIRAIIIDGIGDLVRDPNDSEESFTMIDDLVQLAMEHQTGIVTVLHENPGSESGKTRGHLGSQLERKAETNLRLAKDVSGITTVWADRARHGHLPKDNGICFEWNDTAGMHVSCGTATEIKAQATAHAMEEEVALCIGAVTKPVTYSEVVGYIGEALGLKERAAKNRITKWQTHGFITKQPDGKYTKNQ